MTEAAEDTARLPGRDLELGRLAEGLDRVAGGSGALYVLVGEAGMGKTRLTAEISDRARDRGFRVVAGHCWETVDAPALWPWSQVLDQLESPDGRLAGAAASLGGRSAGASGEHGSTARAGLVQSVAVVLREAAAAQPLLVVLEDLHAADETSLLVLQYVAEVSRQVPMMIVATYDEVSLAARSTRSRMLNEIARRGERVDLRGLTPVDIAEVYRRLTGESAPDATVDALVESTQGNPLFVEESIRLLTAEGDLFRPDHSVGFRVPGGLRDVLAARLTVLPDATRELLSVASVVGRRFEAALVARATGIDVNEVLELLEPALSTGLLKETGALGEFQYAHVLVREALYEGVPVSRRMKMHREIAQALDGLFGVEDEARLSERAHHWFKAAQAGDAAKTIDYTTRAADIAARAGAAEEAARLYQRALKLLDTTPGERGRRREVEARLRGLRGDLQATVDAPEADEFVFRREGDFWTIRFGGDVARLKDTKGMRVIATLLANPGREMHALELASSAGDGSPRAHAPDEVEVDLAGADAILDATAKAQFRRRIEELEAEVAESEQFNDLARADRARAELDELRAALASALGLGGRDRKLGSAAERARISVTKTVKDALRRIQGADPALGKHLAATLKTGTFCSYSPDPRVPLRWKT